MKLRNSLAGIKNIVQYVYVKNEWQKKQTNKDTER